MDYVDRRCQSTRVDLFRLDNDTNNKNCERNIVWWEKAFGTDSLSEGEGLTICQT